MKKKIDPESEAAMEAVAHEQRMEELAGLQLKKREIAAAVTFEEIGKIKAMNFTRAQGEFMTLIILKRLKDSKGYKEELGLTWQQVCDMVGMSRADVDRKLVDLKPYSDELLALFSNFAGFDYNKIKYLGHAQKAGIAQIEQKCLVYNGERIPLTPDHHESLQLVLDSIQDDLVKRAEDAEADLKGAKRTIRDRQAELDKKNKLLDKYEGRARDRDLSPEEDGFLAQMEQARIGFDGYMLTVEPTKMDDLGKAGSEEQVTPRMRAAYIELLGYMKKQIVAAYDTAEEMFGADLVDRRPS